MARVCRKLDGIPLAIELATARMGSLAVEQVAQRLETSLGVLKGTSRTAAPRQQTLSATLDWSFDLLAGDERTFFGRLSVFAGGWTLGAAEAVCSGDGIEKDNILDLLGGLVDKSLVVAGEASSGALRYRMLEPVRQYAREKFDEGREGESIRKQHAEYFLALAAEAEPEVAGPLQRPLVGRLKNEHDNIRVALLWAFEGGDPGLGLRLAGALRWFWEEEGYYEEGRRWLEQALTKGTRTSNAARAKALDGIGWLAFGQGDMDRAMEAAEEGLKLSPETRTEPDISSSLRNLLANLARSRGNYKRATELFEESLVLDKEVGDKWAIAWSLSGLAAVSSDLGDHERAVELYEESMALSRETDYVDQLADNLTNLGHEFLLRGDHEQAAALNEEALEIHRKREHRDSGVMDALDNLGWAALLQGDHDRAAGLLVESLLLCRELGVKLIAVGSLEGLACLAAAKGEADRAIRIFGAAETLRERIGYHQAPKERELREPYLTAARSRLGEAAWEAVFAQGRSMSLQEASEYALSEEADQPEATIAQEHLTSAEPMGNLTPRELEIVLLVARGLTNRQIAGELSISVRTAGNHVAKIMRKLGLSSRTQIGALVVEDRPYASPRD